MVVVVVVLLPAMALALAVSVALAVVAMVVLMVSVLLAERQTPAAALVVAGSLAVVGLSFWFATVPDSPLAILNNVSRIRTGSNGREISERRWYDYCTNNEI